MLAAPLACALLCAPAYPPPAGANQAAPRKSGRKADAGASRARREVREAVAALKEAAETARSFDDLYEGVRAQAEAADAVWPFDEQWARSALRRAWEAANAPGAEDRVRGFGTSEDPRDDALDALTAARRFAVKTALRHDARLGQALMAEFERGLADRAAATRGGPQASAPEGVPRSGAADPAGSAAPRRRERTLSPAGWQRLFIARQFLEEGDLKQAARSAAPLVAEGPSLPLLRFVLDLRAHDAAAADALYLRLLEAARADAGAGVNDVLLLSTPVVSPGLLVSVGAGGAANFMPLHYEGEEGRRAAAALPADARRAFFDAAASVLLRPRPAGDGAQAADGAAALYFAVGRLLPFFEREAAQHAPALHARLAALAADIGDARRDSLDAQSGVRSLSPENPVDPLRFELAAIKGARAPSERDFMRLRAVLAAARSGLWERARRLAAEAEGEETRRAARLVIAVQQVMRTREAYDDEEPDSPEHAAAFVRASDVPPEVRAAGLAQAAELAGRHGQPRRADELLAEAEGYAAQAGREEGARATALALVTLSAARAGSGRVWGLLPALVRAADESDDLPFAALTLEFPLGPGGGLSLAVPAAPVGLGEVFAAAARLDAVKAFTEARGFADGEMRAAALLAAGRAALEKNARAGAATAR